MADNLLPKEVKESGIITNLDRALQSGADFIRGNPIAVAAIGAGAVGIAAAARRVVKRRKKKVTKKRKVTRKKARKKPVKKRKTKRKVKSRRKPSKRIRKTKNGQPYIILPNGRARFISKKSARLRRKRKGGFF